MPLVMAAIPLAAALAALPPLEETGASKRRPVPVMVQQTPKGWKLLRAGWPYFVRGACVWGENVRFDELRAAGANSVRTYHSKYARWTLDAAARRDMTVLLGFEINNEHHGFSYLSESDVSRQREAFLAYVRKHKDHPALLAWGIGNEVEMGVENPVHLEAMWKELNILARLCKQIDPNHPTAIILAGVTDEKLEAVEKWCPDVDIICFNTYGGLRNLPARLNKAQWKRPYLVTEFGAQGWWEAPQTKWGAPIEATSTQKAKDYLIAYERGVLGDRKRCLGSYVFFWEPKQEATATWFGMFLPGGERLEMIDAMTQAWSRRRPKDRCPQIKTLEFASPKEHFLPGEPIRVKLAVSEPEKQPMGVAWRIFEEAPPFTPGNGYEIIPRSLRDQIITPVEDGAVFPAPAPGAYRIFVFVYDGHGNAATGNLCFLVSAPEPKELEIVPGTPAP
jgi:hypothetical protein